MIGYLSGKYIESEGSLVTMEVAGIGYELLCTNTVIVNLPIQGEETIIYTYMNVREDEVSLFGFSTKAEKRLFLQLLSVNGVGAKTALVIISSCNYADLVSSITLEDVSIVAGVKGIGKKTAERIILELKDKIDITDMLLQPKQSSSEVQNTAQIQDAIMVLTTLGLKQSEALTESRRVAEIGDTAEEIVSKVLKGMGR